MKRHASGRYALGQCARCGFTAPYKQLVADEYKPGLRVHPWCKDEKHPAEKPIDAGDAVNLKYPAPDLDDDSAGNDGTTVATALGFTTGTYFGSGS